MFVRMPVAPLPLQKELDWRHHRFILNASIALSLFVHPRIVLAPIAPRASPANWFDNSWYFHSLIKSDSDLIVNRKFNILLDSFRGSGMNGA